jgi:hypothetical protein
MEQERLIVKFNGGRGAILCSGCRVIIKEGYEFTPEETKYIRGEIEYLPIQFCDKCKSNQNDNNSKGESTTAI